MQTWKQPGTVLVNTPFKELSIGEYFWHEEDRHLVVHGRRGQIFERQPDPNALNLQSLFLCRVADDTIVEAEKPRNKCETSTIHLFKEPKDGHDKK